MALELSDHTSLLLELIYICRTQSHAYFMGQQHTEQKSPSYLQLSCCRGGVGHTGTCRHSAQVQIGAFSIHTPQWASCLYLFISAVWLNFTRLLLMASTSVWLQNIWKTRESHYHCVVRQQSANYFVITPYNYWRQKLIPLMLFG